MKRAIAVMLIAVVAAFAIAAKKEEGKDVTVTKEIGMRHVVMFKYKEGTSAEDMAKVMRAFLDLKSKVDVIVDVEAGSDVGVENLSKGFQHCFIVSFADAAGRDAYLPHPAHKEFVAFLQPYLEDVHVIDFVPQR